MKSTPQIIVPETEKGPVVEWTDEGITIKCVSCKCHLSLPVGKVRHFESDPKEGTRIPHLKKYLERFAARRYARSVGYKHERKVLDI